MNLLRNDNNGSDKDVPNPMKQVQTPQVPTKEQRDDGNKYTFTGGSQDGKDK